MKKLILFLLIFCSEFSQAQVIPIPQVIGLPAALNSKVDKVTGKSLVADTLSAKIQPHVTNISNPHATTKAQIGLGSADNTSDVNKPVSLAQKAALDLKQTVFTGICQEQFLTENDIFIDNTAMTLTIATVKNGQAISALNPICFYTDGNGVAVKHEKTAPVVFNFTNTDGVWYFYFDSSGNPIATQTVWSDFATIATVYRFYWNSTLSMATRNVIESIEFHKNDISWADHQWKHSEGTKYLHGFNISHNAITSGTPNINGSNAVIALSSGTNIDDNMEYSVDNASSGSVKFTQNLGTGTLPATSGKFICISNDASGLLEKIPATDFPFLWNTTTNIPQYLTTTGVRTDVAANNYFVYYIYALQDPRCGEAIKIKSAETDFSTSTLAAAHNWEQLQAIFPTLRDGEIRLLYKLTFEYKSTFDAGTKKAALRVVDDLRKQKTTTTATAGGLLPATSVVVTPIGNIASTNVQSALQELDSEKQPVGAYLTSEIDGSVINEIQDLSLSGNTLTLSSDATSVDVSQATAVLANTAKVSNANHSGDATGSTVLTLTTVNSNIGTYNNVTINAKGLATAGSNVGYLTGITSGQVTTALGYTPWWASNHPTTLSGYGITDTPWTSYLPLSGGTLSGTSPNILTVNRTNSDDNISIKFTGATISNWLGYTGGVLKTGTNSDISTQGKIVYHSGNLTNTLSTNYIPKWNGNDFVNSQALDNSTTYKILNSVNSNLLLHSSATNGKNWSINSRSDGYLLIGVYGVADYLYFKPSGDIVITNTTTSTSPSTGALVVGGGVGADHVRANNFYGNGSNLSGVQLPITITTDGTSGAAAMTGTNINIPNYSSNSSSGNGSVSASSISNFTGVAIKSHVYSVVGSVVTESITFTATAVASGYASISVAPAIPSRYELQRGAGVSEGNGLLSASVIVKVSSGTGDLTVYIFNGFAGASYNITAMIQYEIQ